MIHIWAAVQWWDEWQLRILVLGSLGLQWFLLLAAPMRKYIIPRWFRTCIWLVYISSDALSIYALATLFNRHAKGSSGCEYGAKASSLEVLWAPVILVHLGGREEITAYSIEDNELWTRQTVTLVSQVTVAVYAFCKSWPDSSDRRLLLSAILLFIVGILSFCEKPWALKRASINRLVAVSSLIEGKRKRPRGWECFFAELDDRYKCWKKMPEGNAPILSDGDRVQMILSDLSLYAAFSDLKKRTKTDQELQVLQKFKSLRGKEMRSWLRRAFGLIYTRANVIFTPAYLACHVLLVPSVHIAAITLFAASNKQGYSRTDVKTTYILLCFTAVLDVLGVLISELLYRLMSRAGVPALCETLPAYNLIDTVLKGMKPATGWLRKCATRVGFREGYFVQERDAMYRRVSGFIASELVDVSNRDENNADLSTYRSFTNRNWTLDEELQKVISAPKQGSSQAGPTPVQLTETTNQTSWHTVPGSSQADLPAPGQSTEVLIEVIKQTSSPTDQRSNQSEIWRSLRKSSFDESVILWHIATDLCFRIKPPKGFRRRPPHENQLRDICTESISNYMAHLLNFHPEMLLTGSRQHLFAEAMRNVESILQGKEKQGAAAAVKRSLCGNKSLHRCGERKVAEKIMRKAEEASGSKYPLIRDACKLAKELMDMDQETRGRVMYRVWVGMLCYSASMCRGYLHAKSLGEGGEFLSFVWLIISLKGAKTLADKLQMPDPEPGDGDDGKPQKQPDAQATEDQKKKRGKDSPFRPKR
ncbi:uncharacterized protein LOC133905233 [Phragmites australis]|uniref:uncharacterized protein LOC133905233 n=1 Tax=Phragmites australis TaxID=29695 RepID=UPI002D7709E8|nr:uncharacterized protein LOC133905233 [Phragmites australis]